MCESVIAWFDLRARLGQILEFVTEHTDAQAQLAGNSIHVDFLFLKKYMPRLASHLHYRLVDVTTVVEIARRWFPNAHRKAPKKRVCHQLLRGSFETY